MVAVATNELGGQRLSARRARRRFVGAVDVVGVVAMRTASVGIIFGAPDYIVVNVLLD